MSGDEFANRDDQAEQPLAPESGTAHWHISALLARVGEVPSGLRDKASSFVSRKYEQLSERYTETGAKAVLAAMVLLTPVPLPGTSLLPIALAEGVKQLSGLVTIGGKQLTGLVTEGGKQMTGAVGSVISEMQSGLELLAQQIGISLDELEKMARELSHEAMRAEKSE